MMHSISLFLCESQPNKKTPPKRSFLVGRVLLLHALNARAVSGGSGGVGDAARVYTLTVTSSTHAFNRFGAFDVQDHRTLSDQSSTAVKEHGLLSDRSQQGDSDCRQHADDQDA